MKKQFRNSLLFCLAAGLSTGISACAVVSSTRFGEASSLGPVYSLPTTTLPLALTATGTRLVMTIGEPQYRPDPAHRYVALYQPDPGASDTVEINIDRNGLLASVQTTASDQTDEIIVEVARTAAAFLEAASSEPPPPPEVTLLRLDLDPSDSQSVRQVACRVRSAIESYRLTRPASESAMLQRSAADFVFGVRAGEEGALEAAGCATHPTATPAPLRQAAAVDCSVGVCSRTLVPYTIGFGFGGDVAFERTIDLPNQGEVIAIDLPRALFVDRVTNITFANGLVSQVHIVKPSELLEAAQLPLEIVRAILRVPAELLTLRTANVSGDAGRIEAQARRIRAQADLLAAQSGLAQAQSPPRQQQPPGLESAAVDSRRVLLSGSNGVPPPATAGSGGKPSSQQGGGPGSVAPSHPQPPL